MLLSFLMRAIHVSLEPVATVGLSSPSIAFALLMQKGRRNCKLSVHRQSLSFTSQSTVFFAVSSRHAYWTLPTALFPRVFN